MTRILAAFMAIICGFMTIMVFAVGNVFLTGLLTLCTIALMTMALTNLADWG